MIVSLEDVDSDSWILDNNLLQKKHIHGQQTLLFNINWHTVDMQPNIYWQLVKCQQGTIKLKCDSKQYPPSFPQRQILITNLKSIYLNFLYGH